MPECIAVSHMIQYTRFAMLFHEKTRKAAGIGFVVVTILVVISMIIMMFPTAWR